MNRLSIQERARILGCLVEGNSMRATSRLCGVSINTVTKLLVEVGTACNEYQDKILRNLTCKRMQCDEIWSFCQMKERNVPANRKGVLGYGDIWTWTALDPDTKLIACFLVGERSAASARAFIGDLAGRLLSQIQLTTDGYRPYINAVEKYFGGDIDYSVLKKLYSNPIGNSQEQRYSSGQCCGTIRGIVCGNPDQQHVSTSHVERQNLTMRMGMRRFTRLTNGFSRKVENLECAVALHFMHYNFGRIHKTLRVTPAMEAGISDHVLSLEEIAALVDEK